MKKEAEDLSFREPVGKFEENKERERIDKVIFNPIKVVFFGEIRKNLK